MPSHILDIDTEMALRLGTAFFADSRRPAHVVEVKFSLPLDVECVVPGDAAVGGCPTLPAESVAFAVLTACCGLPAYGSAGAPPAGVE